MRASEFIVTEDLRKWFKEKWVRFGPDGKIRGSCARGSEKEGKPKCLPQSKAHALGKKGRASAAARKRRQDPNPERRGRAKNVATKKTTTVEGKVILSRDPNDYGAYIDYTDFDKLPVEEISLKDLVVFEPIEKMNLTTSKNKVKRILAKLKKGLKIPPIFVRKYKGRYQVIDGHHRFRASQLFGAKTISARIVPPKNIEIVKLKR